MGANAPPAEKYLAVTIRDKIIIALPKGRVLEAGIEMLGAVGILPEYAFFDKESRQLRFSTNRSDVDLIRVRSFDVATFVAFGAAHIGIAGSDVLLEYEYAELYAPLDLGIGRCRLVVAEPEAVQAVVDPRRWSHVRVATKYPNLTRRHFATRGVQAECVKLHGAMELAPALGLCRRIVDLVETGSTLRANGLVEVETIAEVSSRLVVNRVALKTRPVEIRALVEKFNEVARGNTT
jgi:ATP phosphoribosyltransferase